MSAKITEQVWEYSKAKGNDKLVLLVIADNADTGTRVGYPGQKLISMRTGIGIRTVGECVKRLVAADEITVKKRRAKSGPKVYNTYTICEYDLSEPSISESARSADSESAESAEEPRTEDIPQTPPSSESSADDDPKSNKLVAFYCDLITKMGGIVDKRAKGQTAGVIKTLLSDGFTEAHLQMALADQVARNTHPSILGQHAQKASIGARPGTEAFSAESAGEPDDAVARSRRRFAADDEYDKTAVGIGDVGINPAKILEEIG